MLDNVFVGGLLALRVASPVADMMCCGCNLGSRYQSCVVDQCGGREQKGCLKRAPADGLKVSLLYKHGAASCACVNRFDDHMTSKRGLNTKTILADDLRHRVECLMDARAIAMLANEAQIVGQSTAIRQPRLIALVTPLVMAWVEQRACTGNSWAH